jgi:hypothetical protein
MSGESPEETRGDQSGDHFGKSIMVEVAMGFMTTHVQWNVSMETTA